MLQPNWLFVLQSISEVILLDLQPLDHFSFRLLVFLLTLIHFLPPFFPPALVKNQKQAPIKLHMSGDFRLLILKINKSFAVRWKKFFGSLVSRESSIHYCQWDSGTAATLLQRHRGRAERCVINSTLSGVDLQVGPVHICTHLCTRACAGMFSVWKCPWSLLHVSDQLVSRDRVNPSVSQLFFFTSSF